MSIKDMMKGGPKQQQKQLKDDLSVFPEEVQQKFKFFTQLFAFVRKSGSMSNDSGVVREIYIANRQHIQVPKDERTAKNWIADFFSDKEFLVRLNLHREHICKSKTKKQQALKLYFVEIQAQEKQINLIDCADGLKIIQNDIDEKKRAVEEKERKRQEDLAAKQEKAKLNKSRMAELAKPNDKWKVGKKLIELQKQFPHDRVLQRMVKQEFASN